MMMQEFEDRLKRCRKDALPLMVKGFGVMGVCYALFIWAANLLSPDLSEDSASIMFLAIFLNFVIVAGSIWYMSHGVDKLPRKHGLICPDCGAALDR